MKAIVYSGPGWSWCDRVKALLTDNNYEIKEVRLDRDMAEGLSNKYNKQIRSIPQVVIDEKLIGGYNEVEDLMKGLTAINKV